MKQSIGAFVASIVALSLLQGCAVSKPDTSRATLRYVTDLPLDPQDEAQQTSAYTTAFLNCTCLFVEGSDEARCIADWPAGAKLERKIDRRERSVTITVGRWIAVARDQGDSRGCGLL